MSIHRHRCPCTIVKAGQSATLAIRVLDSIDGDKTPTTILSSSSEPSVVVAEGEKRTFQFRRGQVILSHPPDATSTPMGSMEFQAELNFLGDGILFPGIGYEGIVYCGSVRQAVRILSVGDVEEGGRRVGLRFVNEAEWLVLGGSIILCIGELRFIGKILAIEGS